MKSLSMRRALALALSLVATAACGGSDSTGPGNDGNNDGSNNSVTCTVTLSGALTGSPACSDASAIRTDNIAMTSFSLDAADDADTVSVVVSFAGPPTTTTYDLSTGGDALLFVNNATNMWNANSTDGSWSLTISSVKAGSSDQDLGLTEYEVHGTLTATLIPEIFATATDPVTLTATF